MQVTVTPPPDARVLQQRALLDLAERARGGIVIHFALWMVLGWTNGLPQLLPSLFWTQAALFVGVMALRFGFERRLASRATASRAAYAGFLALLLSSPLQWGLLGAVTWGWPPMAGVQMPMAMVIVGVASSGGLGLAINTVVRLVYPLMAVAPVGLLMSLSPSSGDFYLGSASLVFVGYLFMASKTIHADYWAAANARGELEARAQQLERMSVIDALTQVHNRQFLDRQIEVEWSRAERDAQALSMLMIDIDHFKGVNDTHGHPFGDACLRAVAQALQGALNRPGDLLARYGGEEFAVLLPGVGSAGAAIVAARLHQAVSALAMQHDGTPVPLTCSIGVHSVADIVDCTPAQVISVADQALYSAKRQGRNRVVAAEVAMS